MQKRKLGIICECIQGEDALITLERMKNAGFECFFSGAIQEERVRALKEKADSLGLEFQFIHAPFAGINAMWQEGDEYQKIWNGMTEAIASASACGVPIVICHVSSGWKAPEINELGLSRFDALVDFAEQRNVIVAFENLRKVGNLAYFVDRYEERDCVRFCYDCGHEHCYTKTVPWMDIFCHRTICTHIHDNFGRGWEKTGDPDIHLLPFDGNCDYRQMMRKLNEYDYAGSLMLEVNNHREPYRAMDPDAFLQDCYQRVSKIAALGEE